MMVERATVDSNNELLLLELALNYLQYNTKQAHPLLRWSEWECISPLKKMVGMVDLAN
jgi:hypothetical protein